MVSYTSTGTNAWLQTGWYSGAGGECQVSGGNYRLYVEWKRPGEGAHCVDVSPLALGGSVIYRVQFAGNGCWDAFYNYSTLAVEVCGMPNSMVAEMNNELLNNSGGTTVMPRSVFGASDPNTNNALRLLGASGYQPWDSALTVGGTLYYDERQGTAPYYYMSSQNLFFNELTYGG